MALNFQGDRAVGVLNDPKNTFNTDDLFRVYDGGILVAGGVSVDHGDFVSWDGTKWKLETDIKIARSDEISNTNSSIAPNYTKKTYEANSYVMQDGVLYTNENAIGTAEDWNPAHWTQTTVAEIMAGAGATKWTHRTESLTINGGATEEIDIQDHEVVDLTVQKGTGPGAGDLSMHLYGECYVLLDKSYNIRVATLIGDSNTNTTDVNPGLATLNGNVVTALAPAGSSVPEEYSQDDFHTIGVLSNDTSINMADSSPAWTSPMHALLHFLGEGTLVITQLPN